ncbi:MAG: tRNA epoxyqueuosine(34) reductase QueG, partial [Acidobacteriaceae bacterium]
WLAAMTREDFGQWFYGSPIKRAKYEGFRRNLAIAMGNSGLAKFLPQLQEWSRDEDASVREAALWARGRLTADIVPR